MAQERQGGFQSISLDSVNQIQGTIDFAIERLNQEKKKTVGGASPPGVQGQNDGEIVEMERWLGLHLSTEHPWKPAAEQQPAAERGEVLVHPSGFSGNDRTRSINT